MTKLGGVAIGNSQNKDLTFFLKKNFFILFLTNKT